MKKLTYWVADCLNDHRAYNVRAKTRRACLAEMEERGGRYSAPYKVEVEYDSVFDLLVQCMGEGGGHWEMSPEDRSAAEATIAEMESRDDS